MTLSELCIRRPVMTTLLTAAIVLFGLAGYKQLPVSALPRVDFPTIQVTATLPGASPETMAASVAAPLERQFATIAGITAITSTSSLGQTQITIQFDLDRNIDGAALDVQSAITVAQRKLPTEMTTPPSFQKVNPADQPILFISLRSKTLPLSAINEYADTLMSQRIAQLPGVAQVNIYGAQKYAVRIRVDPDALTARGISLDDIQTAVKAASSITPVGTLNGRDRSLTLQASGKPLHAADYGPLIVGYRNGAPVRLSDVAEVIDSVQNDRTATWFNGTRAITLAIQRQPDANTVKVVDSVKALLPTFRTQIPPAIEMEVLSDRSTSIRESVADVQFTLELTVVLVILVIFLFLRRTSATLIPALALPVSIIGTAAGMSLCGFSLNNVSLLALTLSVGFVVDDAIVMLENIVRYVEQGMKPFDAALKGASEIGFTIISITLSLVAVFIPVLFMGGVVGRIFHEFAVTISIAILVSGFVSLTLTPMLCSRFLKPHAPVEREGWFGRTLEAGFTGLLKGYDASLKVTLRHKRLMLLVTGLSVAATIWAFTVVPKSLFPIEDTGFIIARTEADADVSFLAMTERQKRIAEIIAADPAILAVNSTVGGGFGSTGLNTGSIFMSLKPRAERDGVVAVIARLRHEIAKQPGITAIMQPIQNLQIGARQSRGLYQYTVQSGDISEMIGWSTRLEAEIRKIGGVLDVNSDAQFKSPQAVVDVDYDRALTLGISADEIRNTLYSAYGTRQIASIYTDTNDYQVILEIDPAKQGSAESLGQLYVRSTAGQMVRLDSFAAIRRATGPLTVNHQAQLPAVTLSFNLAPTASLSDVVAKIQAIERDLRVPATVSTGFQGSAQVFQQSSSGQGMLILLTLAVVYIILGVLYESFIHPITILSGLPVAGLGAVATLLLAGMDLSLIAVIGIVMLIGIVKKNAIMMVDFAVERRSAGEMRAEKAIYEACLLRFRPIMMTTMAAIMGTLPIAVGHGAGSELRQPLGICVVGGLVVSQLLTLYITPVVYIYLDRLTPKRPKPVSAEILSTERPRTARDRAAE